MTALTMGEKMAPAMPVNPMQMLLTRPTLATNQLFSTMVAITYAQQPAPMPRMTQNRYRGTRLWQSASAADASSADTQMGK